MAKIQSRKDNRGRKLKDGERQRSDGRYEYRYVAPITGKRVTIYDMDLSVLRQKEREIQRKIDDNILTTGEIKASTVNAWYEQYMEVSQIDANTRVNYTTMWEKHIRDSLGQMKITDVRASHIKALYGEMSRSGYAASTIKVLHCILCPVFNMAYEDEVINRNPVSGQLSGFGSKAKEKEALTPEQQDKLLDYVKNNPTYKNHLPMLQIMIGTACRVGELAGLTWADVDQKAREMNIDHQLIYKNLGDGCRFHVKDPKTEAGIRIIPLTDEVSRAFTRQKEYQFAAGIDHSIEVEGLKNFVFTSKNGMPLAPNAVNNVLYNIVNAYNTREASVAAIEKRKPELMPKISAHIMRHTGCTRMAESGMDPKVLQYIMGHSDISITMNVYNHISDIGRVKREMLRIENEKKMIVG